MTKKIILITGGQRSGKSTYGEEMALHLAKNPVYLATSRIWDEEHKKRILLHKARRTERWINREEEKSLSQQQVEGKVVLIDCITLWATNFFFDLETDIKACLDALKNEFDNFTSQNATFIFITNEIGMGEMSMNKNQRKFADLQGWLNQYIAMKSDEVYLMVCGISTRIK